MSPDTRHRLFYTPEFQMTVVELSSPVALLVAFWGEYVPTLLLSCLCGPVSISNHC